MRGGRLEAIKPQLETLDDPAVRGASTIVTDRLYAQRTRLLGAIGDETSHATSSKDRVERGRIIERAHEGTRIRSSRSRMIASLAANSPACKNDLPTIRWARTGQASTLMSSGTT